jgi:ribokinase
MPAMQVHVVDTTGAGDAFNGTLATYLASGMPLEPAVRHAVAAGALACTKLGVIPSLPNAAEIKQLLSSG